MFYKEIVFYQEKMLEMIELKAKLEEEDLGIEKSLCRIEKRKQYYRYQ